jgi:hypothetical protein
MNWKFRALSFALLSRMPGGIKLYHFAQKRYRLRRFNGKVSTERALEIVRLIQDAGACLNECEVVEIGTGWRPVLPYVLYLLGAKRIRTYDINRWLTRDYALDTWRAMEDNLETISTLSGRSSFDVKSAYYEAEIEGLDLDKLLQALRITYKSPEHFENSQIRSDSVDFVVSSNVLEHIPADLLSRMHKESHRILRGSALCVHRFNPQDHFAELDPSISNINFLRFSEKKWQWYGGSGLAYHNRLRSSDHRKLFESAGFNMECYQNRIDERSRDLLKSGLFPLDSKFIGYSIEDLATDYVWALGRKI